MEQILLEFLCLWYNTHTHFRFLIDIHRIPRMRNLAKVKLRGRNMVTVEGGNMKNLW